jgi:hypothetical protein
VPARVLNPPRYPCDAAGVVTTDVRSDVGAYGRACRLRLTAALSLEYREILGALLIDAGHPPRGGFAWRQVSRAAVEELIQRHPDTAARIATRVISGS